MANLTTEQMLGGMRDKISQTFARQDGFYETMGVGTAVNLAGQEDRSNSDKFRTSGGTEDIATGTARLESIKGNAIAWNQLCNNDRIRSSRTTITKDGNYINVTTLSTGSIRRIAWVGSTVVGHKYFVKINVKNTYSEPLIFRQIGLNPTNDNILDVTVQNGEEYTLKRIFECTDDSDEVVGVVRQQTTNSTYRVQGQTFDLTLIYGLGHEPSTPEQFEADYKRWFGKALTYEEYDAGSLKPVLMTGYKTVGFNLLDPTTGKAHLVGTYGNTNVEQGLYCYEITGNYTAITDEDGNAITPVNGFFMVENPQEITVTGADENTCIHLTWSGWRNGESEAYWSDLSPIPVTTLTGKLNGTGASVVVFPDGMKSAGDVFDEIKVENGVVKAVKRIATLDLGAKADTLSASGFKIPASNSKDPTSSAKIPNILTPLYPAVMFGDWLNNDKAITRATTSKNFFVLDSSYDNLESFKTAMSGVIMYYELATPQEYVLDNFELPIRFKVDDFGTEEQIGEGVASILTLKYGVNAVDVLRRLPQNYISVESMDNFLAQLGVAMNGTWSRTWNESNQEYDFTFVPNSEPTPEPENANNQEEA